MTYLIHDDLVVRLPRHNVCVQRTAAGIEMTAKHLDVVVKGDTRSKLRDIIEAVIQELETLAEKHEVRRKNWRNIKIPRYGGGKPTTLAYLTRERDIETHNAWNHIGDELVKVYEKYGWDSEIPDLLHDLLESDIDEKDHYRRVGPTWLEGPIFPTALIAANGPTFNPIKFYYRKSTSVHRSIETFSKDPQVIEQLQEIWTFYSKEANEIVTWSNRYQGIAWQLLRKVPGNISTIVRQAPPIWRNIQRSAVTWTTAIDLAKKSVTARSEIPGPVPLFLEIVWTKGKDIDIVLVAERLKTTYKHRYLDPKTLAHGTWLATIEGRLILNLISSASRR